MNKLNQIESCIKLMKSLGVNVTVLYDSLKNLSSDREVESGSSIDNIFSQKEAEALRWLRRETNLYTTYPGMMVDRLEGALLKLIVQEVFKKKREQYVAEQECISAGVPIQGSPYDNVIRILEIGTFTGYSMLSLASGVGYCVRELGASKESIVESIEINEEHKELTDSAIARSGLGDFTKVIFGDAKEIMQGMREARQEFYDIIFIDANKREYADYYSLAIPLLRKRGYLLADNVMWYGKVDAPFGIAIHGDVVASPHCAHDAQSVGVERFNQVIADEAGKGNISATLISHRDGLLVVWKLR